MLTLEGEALRLFRGGELSLKTRLERRQLRTKRPLRLLVRRHRREPFGDGRVESPVLEGARELWRLKAMARLTQPAEGVAARLVCLTPRAPSPNETSMQHAPRTLATEQLDALLSPGRLLRLQQALRLCVPARKLRDTLQEREPLRLQRRQPSVRFRFDEAELADEPLPLELQSGLARLLRGERETLLGVGTARAPIAKRPFKGGGAQPVAHPP